MAIKTYKPMTNGQRGMSTLINDEVTKTTPEKSLVVTLKKKGGRNNTGRITVRHHGGGAKRKYRQQGVAGLLAKYGHKNMTKGIDDEYFEYFKISKY